MNKLKTDVLIFGGGLTGLSLAYFLQKANINFIVVEAIERLEVRILTKSNTNQAPIELGAT
ncbi:MAG: NAD(P)-binding protein [Winogradskyella sp.]|uniref:NAD(P)-binding protein n=1 Tax=Winogradskyella sp. TaxID=1883156 RepID=UPI00184EB4E1|nr:NAD(P)-binding protein [Winogradskyella sp.]NNK23534.1 NAD(P)-binding protein [Winogradskyella sp.]